MSHPPDIEAILARRHAIAVEIEKLTVEDRELETAVRVLQRFGNLPMGDGPKKSLGPPRPADTPSLFDMTEIVIRDAIKAGKAGLRGREIVAEIGKKYWPGVKPEQVLPPIYGFVKKKRLKKGSDGIFKPVTN